MGVDFRQRSAGVCPIVRIALGEARLIGPVEHGP
jgi:hypothetical protein